MKGDNRIFTKGLALKNKENRKQKAIREGRLAKKYGKEIIDNPYLCLGKRGITYAALWEKGFNE